MSVVLGISVSRRLLIVMHCPSIHRCLSLQYLVPGCQLNWSTSVKHHTSDTVCSGLFMLNRPVYPFCPLVLLLRSCYPVVLVVCGPARHCPSPYLILRLVRVVHRYRPVILH